MYMFYMSCANTLAGTLKGLPELLANKKVRAHSIGHYGSLEAIFKVKTGKVSDRKIVYMIMK